MTPLCRCCRTPTLTHREFLRACADSGLVLINGQLFGSLTDATTAPKFREIEAKLRFKCEFCQLTYCLSCLKKFAPTHTGGGSACPACGKQFNPIQ
jgi:hypothetical protein